MKLGCRREGHSGPDLATEALQHHRCQQQGKMWCCGQHPPSRQSDHRCFDPLKFQGENSAFRSLKPQFQINFLFKASVSNKFPV